MKYKFIHFEEIGLEQIGIKPGWRCRNNKTDGILGYVQLYDPWNQYVFETIQGAVFSFDCLADIRDFLLKVTKERKPDGAKG